MQYNKSNILKMILNMRSFEFLKAVLSAPLSSGALDLSGIPLAARDMERLCAHLQRHASTLVSMEMGFSELTDDAFLLLLPALAALPHLETLALNGNRLTRAVLKELTDALKFTQLSTAFMKQAFITKEKHHMRKKINYKSKSGIERLSECGLDSVEESHGVRDAVEGQNTCSGIQLQLSVIPLQLSDLLLQLLLKLSDSTHFSSLPGSDLLLHVRASVLHEPDQLSEDLLTVLHCFISREVEGLHLLMEQLQVFLSVLDPLLDVESTPLQLSLPLGPFCCSCDCVVAFMFFH
ncbi:Leucine-rich repeat-containing protein 75A [Liparis tanakae]|uniref:Leucine-rich repeat-containing protein 75A n=1 Tax=Liparis tanakae TaxID=230148 RepID=A0A4Z2FPW7_9TELE|nr:Leucine-rich repeat-containing protein 75A [Liparis tanakae]